VPVNVNPNQFSTRWQIPMAEVLPSWMYMRVTLTTYNGQFFNAGNKILYARKEFDGSLVWQYDFSGLQFPSVNPPAVANGIVYIAAGQQDSTFMFAFNAADGTLIFKTPMRSQWDTYLAPTIGAKGVYANAGTYGGLYAFNTSGQQMFFAQMAQTDMWTPAVDVAGVYTYTGGILQVIDPSSGAVLNSITDPTFQNYSYEIDGSPVLGAAGSVFVANYNNAPINNSSIGNTLLNFNVSKNIIAWQIHGVYPSTPAYAEGVLYVANENPIRLEARAESDGTLLWSWTPPQAGDTNFKSEVLLTNNLVFVSTNLSIYAIDMNTHRTVWSYPLMGKLALSQNGILYIQGQNFLIAINLK
jgi:outer membrane protein assembly factor BamB